jgi:uncharacterized protein (TIGR00251 family)
MDACQIIVRVTPRSGRDEVIGWEGDQLRVRVRAAPVEGQANAAVCRLIAKAVSVPVSAVEVVGGATARIKILRIEGLPLPELQARLSRSSR